MAQPSAPATKKRSLIDTLCDALGANKSDLTQLLIPINKKKAAKQQIQWLLRQSFQRLVELRHAVTELLAATEGDEGLHAFVQQAHCALQVEAPLSLENTSQAFESLLVQYADSPISEKTIAEIRGVRALIASLQQDHQHAVEYYEAAAATPNLSPLLRWHYQIQMASVLEDLGRDFSVNHALHRAISLLEEETLPLVPMASHPGEWATTKQHLGNVQGILGQRQGGTRSLEDAIASLQASLEARDRSAHPLPWAETQNSLGNALGILGHRQKDESLLSQCIAAFEAALEERSRENSPHEWATTQNNLAAVLQSVGQTNKDTKMLKQAVDAYTAVLQEWTRERAPLDWATAMNNLGTALRLLGEHRKGPRTLEHAVAAYNNALAERSREQQPEQWAMTQNNLGAALQKLAERESNPKTLELAIQAYENAIKEWTRTRAPMSWSMTTANLGVARRTLAEVTGDYQTAIKAVEELDAVSDAFREASHAQYSELIIDQLAQARKLADTLLQQQQQNAAPKLDLNQL